LIYVEIGFYNPKRANFLQKKIVISAKKLRF